MRSGRRLETLIKGDKKKKEKQRIFVGRPRGGKKEWWVFKTEN